MDNSRNWSQIFRTRDMILEKISLMCHSRNGSRNRNEGFYMQVAKYIPEPVILSAIGATNDAYMRSMSPSAEERKPLGDPAKYFAGTLRNLCAEKHIISPIRWEK